MSPLEKLLKSRRKNEHKQQKLPSPCLWVVRMSRMRYGSTGICLPFPWPKTLSGGGGRIGPLSPSFQICQPNKYVCMHHQPHRSGSFRLQDWMWKEQSKIPPEKVVMLLFIHQHCIAHLPSNLCFQIFLLFNFVKALTIFLVICLLCCGCCTRNWENKLLRNPDFNPSPNLWSHSIRQKNTFVQKHNGKVSVNCWRYHF